MPPHAPNHGRYPKRIDPEGQTHSSIIYHPRSKPWYHNLPDSSRGAFSWPIRASSRRTRCCRPATQGSNRGTASAPRRSSSCRPGPPRTLITRARSTCLRAPRLRSMAARSRSRPRWNVPMPGPKACSLPRVNSATNVTFAASPRGVRGDKQKGPVSKRLPSGHCCGPKPFV